jgi:hypothetical protein
MGRAARAKAEVPCVGAGERWKATGGASPAIDLVTGTKRCLRIADFNFGVSETARERARIAAQAPLMYEALLGFISGMREDGALVEMDGRPYQGHGPGCGCETCSGMLALALAEDGGRCILCACTDDDACVSGCAWEPGTDHLICTAHPAKVIAAAKRFLAKGGRRG